jgi:hypothetical protein
MAHPVYSISPRAFKIAGVTDGSVSLVVRLKSGIIDSGMIKKMSFTYPHRKESRGLRSGGLRGPCSKAAATNGCSCRMLIQEFDDYYPVSERHAVLLESASFK